MKFPMLNHLALVISLILSGQTYALEMLEDINLELAKQNIQLHLSEVKGPVMDRLHSSKLLKHLSGNVFLTHYQAIQTLSPQLLKTS